MEPTIVYPARLIRTMDPARPTVQAVAVRGDRIRAVGTTAELLTYPGAVLDERYAQAVLVPGFVEAHSHAGTGMVWQDTYVGMVDRTDPDGRHWAGCRTLEDVVQRLILADSELADASAPLVAWGLDPIFFPGERLSADQLDRVSRTRPIHITHTSGHAVSVNSAAMQLCGINASTAVTGVVKDAKGNPTGELQEMAAIALVASLVEGRGVMSTNETALRAFAQDGVNNGITTLTDLGSAFLMDDAGVDMYQRAADGQFPARLNVFHFGLGMGAVPLSLADAAARLVELRTRSTDKLRFGNVKLMLDGTVQGFTARLMAPGYYGDQPNGIWAASPEEFSTAFETFHRAGILIHVHCNGDQSTQLFLDTLEKVLTAHPRPDHRHTVTHSQLSTPAQYRRMAALGSCANIFANHIWGWGDQHMDLTVGPDRAARMNAAATALSHGVPISLHSDSPVTPLGTLSTMKHAVTRLTMSGRVMGEHERISAEQALHAVTIGSAYMLKMDHEIGSLEAGKFADMAILAEDPLAVPAEDIGEIHVYGTMLGGVHHPSTVADPVTAGRA